MRIRINPAYSSIVENVVASTEAFPAATAKEATEAENLSSKSDDSVTERIAAAPPPTRTFLRDIEKRAKAPGSSSDSDGRRRGEAGSVFSMSHFGDPLSYLVQSFNIAIPANPNPKGTHTDAGAAVGDRLLQVAELLSTMRLSPGEDKSAQLQDLAIRKEAVRRLRSLSDVLAGLSSVADYDQRCSDHTASRKPPPWQDAVDL